jgi:hypothetical protein
MTSGVLLVRRQRTAAVYVPEGAFRPEGIVTALKN